MSSKKAPPPTPNEVRRNILQSFYAHSKKGRAPRGINDVCDGITEVYGYKRPLVKEHLPYLIDLGYILKDVEMTKVRTGSTVRDQPRVTYRIQAKGVEYMEGKSEFSDRDPFPGINVTATGGSIVVLGDGNVVNSNARELYEELGRLRQAVADATELNDAAKLEVSVQIDTIRSQLALDRPNPTVVEAAWDVATKLCTTATLIDYVQRLSPMIGPLLPR